MKSKIRIKPLKNFILASLFTAMATVLTLCLKIPANNGYIHLGDSVIFLAACFLPKSLAVLIAGLSGALADTLGGYAVYVLPTFIIKALLTLAFDNTSKKILTVKNSVAVLFASAITIVGYYITEVVIISASSGQFFGFSALTAALYTIPSSIIQSVGSAIVFFPLAASLDKIKFKDRI